VCHDYPPQGREPAWETTVAEQRAKNIHVRDGVGEEEFVQMREARDGTLEMPTLILPSLLIDEPRQAAAARRTGPGSR
jgi:hypothetical protein